MKNKTSTIDFRTSVAKQKWQSKEELEFVSDIRDRYETMKTARENSCYWASPLSMHDLTNDGDGDGESEITSVDEGQDGETNWRDHWVRCYKAWSMWKSYKVTPNLKSPVSFAPVEAAMGEFKENTVGVTLTAYTEEDEEKVKVIEQALEHLESQNDFGKEKYASLKECLITGTSFDFICWVAKDRDVEIIINSREIEAEIKKANKKRKKEIQDILKDKKPLTKKKTITEYNDVAYIPVSIYEIYPDPDARCLHGKSHEATDLVWRNVMSLEQFKAEYIKSHDPYMIRKNFDKVVSAKRAYGDYGDESSFFKMPVDCTSDNQVEVLRYFNKQKDQYIIIANDVLVRKGPLPYNHKEIPVVQHKFKKFPHQFYGIGLPTVLESLQSEDEALRNMMLKLVYLSGNPAFIVNNNIFNDVEEPMEVPQAGQIVSVSGEIGDNNLRWLQGPASPVVEFNSMRNTIQEDAVKVSGVNPLAYSIAKPNEPVRNNMMAMESTLKSLKQGFKNWAEGQKDAVRQMIAIMKQMYTKDKIIRIEGKEFIKENNGIKESTVAGVSYLKLKPQYLDLKKDPSINIAIDTLVPMSQGLKMQKSEQAMEQLIPLFTNPAMMMAPGVSQLIRDFVETHQLDKKLLDGLQDESSAKEVKDAMQQEEVMEQGIKLAGIHGESDSHKQQHLATYLNWDMERQNVEKELSQQVPPMDPFNIPQPIKEPKKLIDLREKIDYLGSHMTSDNKSKSSYMEEIKSPMNVNEQALGAMPPGMPPQGMPPEMMGGMPQGMPPGMPQGMPPGMPPEAMQASVGPVQSNVPIM